jgi:hypothetical protein
MERIADRRDKPDKFLGISRSVRSELDGFTSQMACATESLSFENWNLKLFSATGIARRENTEGGIWMTELDDAAQLRELCEKASNEYDGEKLIELVRRINELLDKTTGS